MGGRGRGRPRRKTASNREGRQEGKAAAAGGRPSRFAHEMRQKDGIAIGHRHYTSLAPIDTADRLSDRPIDETLFFGGRELISY